MVTTRQTLNDLLMPLAQRTGDPRFGALRKDDPRGYPARGKPWQLDTTLGAIVRAVLACEMEISHLASEGDGKVVCEMMGRGRFMTDRADTPEGAVARCLVALVEALRIGLG